MPKRCAIIGKRWVGLPNWIPLNKTNSNRRLIAAKGDMLIFQAENVDVTLTFKSHPFTKQGDKGTFRIRKGECLFLPIEDRDQYESTYYYEANRDNTAVYHSKACGTSPGECKELVEGRGKGRRTDPRMVFIES